MQIGGPVTAMPLEGPRSERIKTKGLGPWTLAQVEGLEHWPCMDSFNYINIFINDSKNDVVQKWTTFEILVYHIVLIYMKFLRRMWCK